MLTNSDAALSNSELVFETARVQAKMIADGDISSEELVSAHLEQIERVNPAVNAMVTMVADSALEQARAADGSRSAGEELGPLHGLPVAVKDLHDTAGIVTTDVACTIVVVPASAVVLL